MKLKRFLMLLISLLCFLAQSVLVIAQDTQTLGSIYATDVVTAPGSTFDVPVCIKDNPGMMGLGLNIYYDEKILTLVSIKKGTVLQQGMLADSIGASNYEGKIKVLWSHTENVKDDGELFVLQFSVNGEEEGLSELEVVCDSADTFNESWDELEFSTSKATVRVKADVEATETQSSKETEATSDAKVQLGVSKEEDTNARINQAKNIRDELQKKISKEEIKTEVKKALEEFKAEHPKNIAKEEQSRFVQRVSSLMQQRDVEIQSLWENNTTEQKMEVLSYLWEDVSGIQSIEKSKEQHENTMVWKNTCWIVLPIFFLIILGLCFMYRRKRREKKDESKE